MNKSKRRKEKNIKITNRSSWIIVPICDRKSAVFSNKYYNDASVFLKLFSHLQRILSLFLDEDEYYFLCSFSSMYYMVSSILNSCLLLNWVNNKSLTVYYFFIQNNVDSHLSFTLRVQKCFCDAVRLHNHLFLNFDETVTYIIIRSYIFFLSIKQPRIFN